MARLTPFHLIPALIATASQAKEITIEKQPFTIGSSMVATVLPATDSQLFKLEPKEWKDFELRFLCAHGALVKKGDLLIGFDAGEIDRQIADVRRESAAASLAAQQAEFELQTLRESAPLRVESARRTAEIAREENEYFTKVRRKASEDRANRELKRSGQILANQREELRQLTRVTKADTTNGPTAEFILARQEDAVASAEFALSMETLDHKRILEVMLPREAKTLAENERDAAAALARAEVEIPRLLEISKLSLEGKKSALTRTSQRLAALESDRSLFEFKAPADGSFYQIPLEDGRWIPANLAEAPAAGSRLEPNRAFATFVPATAKTALVSFLDEATARALKPDLTGIGALIGREDIELPIRLLKLATLPAIDGNYRADFSITWPDGLRPVVGSTVRIQMISYQQPAAIVVPNRALVLQSSGWTVEVKLADGKTERRPVKRGHVSGEETEIVSGIEVGQVIVLPER